MPTENSTLEDIIQETGNAILNVIEEIGNPISEPQKTLYFLRKMGWNIPTATDFSGKQFSFINNIQTLEIDSPTDFLDLIGNLNNVINDFDKIKDELGLGINFSDFVNEFPRQLLDYTLISYFESEHPKILSVLLFLGIVDVSFVNITSTSRIPFKQNKIVWEKLTTFLQSPDRIPELVYGWGTSNFNDKLLIEHIEYLLNSFGVQTGSVKVEHNKFKLSADSIYAPFFDIENISAGIQIYPIETDTTPQNAGLAISPFLFGSAEEEITLHEFFKLLLSATLKIDKTTGLIIRPKTGASLFDVNDNSTIEGSVKLTLRIGDEDGLLTLGSIDSSKLQIQAVDVSAFSNLNIQTKEFGFEVGLKESKIVIDLAGGDSFITSSLPLEPIEIPLDLTIGYSSIAGIYFKGSAGIEIKLPIHFQLGPIEISGITIGVKLEDKKIPITTSLDFKAELGPLSIVVENIGAFVNVSFPENNKGNTGPFDLAFGFKPPNGLGLSINAGAVIGGGYLFFDFEKEEYAGVLELTIAGFISAKAIGLITTKMPDGSKGFSMLIIITSEFMPAFQLGYGFTLIGVGGLLGLNRTVLLDPLRNAVRTGAVTSIMFPQNVVANAPRIISDLKAIFPPYEGKFLIGPMAKLGWGTPTLISLSLGLIIEIPGNFAILGVLKIALPEERIPLVQIQVLFVGTIDFDKKMLTFDTSLYESFILTMTIEGDMAVRLKWGDNPDFLLSVGGFHPSYTPPPLALPTMRRLAINILNTSIAKIRVECYQAITSNTVQFGARADIMFDLSVCSIKGFISFDALFQFSPFYFIIEVAAGFSLKAAGIDLLSVRVRMSLEGPTPWRARGTGSVSILFFEISADFDVTWGEEKNSTLPDIAILQNFITEIKKKELWSTVLSTGKNLLVSLRKFNDVTEAELLVMHPAGSLVVQQKLLPLKVIFDKIGNQKTSDVQKIEITKATSSGDTLTINDVDENFARAQYQNLSDAEKLSKPSFEKMAGGVSLTLGANTIKNGKLVRKKVKYETTIIDKKPVKPKKGLFFGQIGILFANFLKGNSVSKSVLSKNYTEKLQPFAEKMNVLEEAYTVAFQANNKAFTTGATFTSEMMAQTFMQDQIAKNPSLKKDVHIILSSELQTS